MENRSTNCAKIRNNSKRTKTSKNEVMQPMTSNNHSQPIFPKPCQQPGRFWQDEALLVFYGYFENGFYLGKLERLVFDYTRIILGGWKSDD